MIGLLMFQTLCVPATIITHWRHDVLRLTQCLHWVLSQNVAVIALKMTRSRYPITESDSVTQVNDQLTFGMTVPLRSLQSSSSFEVTYVAAALDILLPSW
jgi:hypothetical protein